MVFTLPRASHYAKTLKCYIREAVTIAQTRFFLTFLFSEFQLIIHVLNEGYCDFLTGVRPHKQKTDGKEFQNKSPNKEYKGPTSPDEVHAV